MEYRQHASVGVLRNDTYYKHVCAMTDEKLRDKSEIAEELAVRDMRIKELEAKLAAMTQEQDKLKDTNWYLNGIKDERLAAVTQERDMYKASVDHYGDLYAKLIASQAYAAQLREALEICKKEMQGDKWDALYIDGVLAWK